MKKVLIIGLLAITLVVLTGCAAGPNPEINQVSEEGKVAGFWTGLWHGCISFITFIISLFNHNVNVYEVHNNGGWYNFGFILGLMIAYGGGGSGGCKAARKR
ncbi:MAG: hypothetical protein JW757_11010 [Anaerolineales bacterium]|nr:hypothetical protein [Anaerolineales bacterium]